MNIINSFPVRIKLLLFMAFMPVCIQAQLTTRMISTPGGPVGFYEFKPPGYRADSAYKYPLIVFMHGVGERGNGTTELPLILTASFGKIMAAHATMQFTVNGRQHAFVVLMPQMSKQYVNWQLFYIDAMMDYAKKNLSIDENKIFLTGWSLGGGGAWKYVTASLDSANRIAGIIPVSPAPNYTNLDNINKGHVAVWAHHAKRDSYIPTLFTDYAIKTINAGKPCIPALATFYAKGGHNFVGDFAYDTLNTFQYPNIYQWMIGITRAVTPENNKPPVPMAGNDTVVLLPSLKTVLHGAGSYDPNDVIVQYAWTRVSGPVSPSLIIDKPAYPETPVSGLEPGKHVFRLAVTDAFGTIRQDDISVLVTLPTNGRNAVPLVDAGPNIETTYTNYQVNGRARDFDGSIKRYKWRQVSGPAKIAIMERGSMADVIGMTALGTYGLELTAFDNHNPYGAGRDTLLITRNRMFPVLVFYWTTNLVDLHFNSYLNFIVFITFVITVMIPFSVFRFYNRH